MRSLKTLIFTTFIALAGLVSVAVTAQETEVYSQAELDQMLAPIALYPDTVLSHVLIAATYPLEVVQAARWTRNNPGYSGQDAVAMVENQDWDPSVKALVAFPELLDKMDKDIGWTQGLGDAFLVQEGEVTDTIQYLRQQAYDNGQLQSNAQVNVVRETKYIYIEPAQPRVVYVPYYDPRVVYGHWRYAAYPPVYWHHPPGFSLSLGFHWGMGYHIQPSFFFSSFYWPSRHVVIVNNHYHNGHRNYGHGKGHGGYRPGYNMAHHDGSRRWKHNSQHRRGVSYRGDVHQDRFSQHDGNRNGDHSVPVRTAQTRGEQRDWADQQRTRYVDSADRPLRGDRSRDQSGADRAGGKNRTGNRDRGDTRNDTVAANITRDGRQRTRDSDAGRRAAPLDAARDNARANPERGAERLRKDLADAGATRRSGPQPEASRNAKREKSNRSVLPTPAGQPAVERRGQNTNPNRGSRAVAENRDGRVTRPTRDSSPKQRESNRSVLPASAGQPVVERRGQNTNPNRGSRAVAENRDGRVTRPTRDSSPKQRESNRSVLPASAGQPVVERRGQNTNSSRGSRAVAETRSNGRVSSPARAASPQRETPNSQRESRYVAAAPQRSPRPAAAPRQAEPQRQARVERASRPVAAPRQAEPQRQRQAPPSRQAAPQQNARVERAPQPERAAQSQRSEPRQGKSERSNQSRGSKARDRNSRD